jgi:hypothetical protein
MDIGPFGVVSATGCINCWKVTGLRNFLCFKEEWTYAYLRFLGLTDGAVVQGFRLPRQECVDDILVIEYKFVGSVDLLQGDFGPLVHPQYTWVCRVL